MLLRLVKKTKLLLITLLLSVVAHAENTNKSVPLCLPNPKLVSVASDVRPLTDFREEGKVLIQLVVTPTGKVIEPTVVESTNPKLNKLAVSASAKWRFEPRKQSCMYTMPMNFTEN